MEESSKPANLPIDLNQDPEKPSNSKTLPTLASLPDLLPQESEDTFFENSPSTLTVLEPDDKKASNDIILPFSKLDINRINELDSLNNRNQNLGLTTTRTFMNGLLKPRRDVFDKYFWKDPKEIFPGPSNFKKKNKVYVLDDDDALEDAKAIANCILENSLNKIDESELESRGEASGPSEGTLISHLLDDLETKEDEEQKEELNEAVVERMQRIDEAVSESREALLDSNSQVSMLDSIDIPAPLLGEEDDPSVIDIPNIILVAAQPVQDNNSAIVPVTNNAFPNWLLQILGANMIEERIDGHDEPHFFCQGDGVGVHPSMVGVEADDDDDSTATSSSSSSTSTEDYAEIELVSSDNSAVASNQQSITLNDSVSREEQERQEEHEAENEEFFDTVETHSQIGFR